LAESLNDPGLLARAKDGEELAFLLLYQRHRDTVFRFAYRMLGSVEASEDVAHDCFVSLMTHAVRFDPSRASLRTYLCGAARNLSLKRLRDEGRELGEEALSEPIRDPQALDLLLADEAARQVQAAVAALPPLQREVVILVEYEDCALAEVAEIVGAEIGTVKARLHRAREGLRARLAGLRGNRPATAGVGGVDE
jgi:RNA polymerase sigma-70 factor (ECF subfamily)